MQDFEKLLLTFPNIAPEQLENVSLKPTKANINVELLTLVWAPFRLDAQQQLKPAWE